MTQLTVVTPNRNRLNPSTNSSRWFIKSLQWQDFTDFEVLIVDGGSDNYEDIKKWVESYDGKIPIKIIQYKIGEEWHKTLLNNVGIRSCNTEYIATTDVDILFDHRFVNTVMPLLKFDTMIESRTMYWKDYTVAKIYSGKLDPYNNIDGCKIGRIKKRTTPGGFQCLHRDQWNKLRGYNEEEIIGWGSEDVELLARVKMAKIKINWLGENINDIMLFHQPHTTNIIENLKSQEKNKRVLNSVNRFWANHNGWGGKG